MTKEPKRLFRFSDAHLIQLMKNTLRAVSDDITEFITWGYTPSLLADIKNSLVEFENLPPDTYECGHQQNATTDRNTYRAELISASRRIQLAAKLALANQPSLVTFGNPRLSKLNDFDLLSNAKTIWRAATANLSALTSKGITSVTLDEFHTLYKAFDICLVDHKAAFIDRGRATSIRIEKANALYNTLVAICAVGKDIWVNKSRAKYNKYVIYHSSKSASTASDEPSVSSVTTPLETPPPVAPIEQDSAPLNAPEPPTKVQSTAFVQPCSITNFKLRITNWEDSITPPFKE